MLFALLTIISAAIAAYFFYSVQHQEEVSMVSLLLGGLFTLFAIAFGVMFMAKRVNKTEDIHVTE